LLAHHHLCYVNHCYVYDLHLLKTHLIFLVVGYIACFKFLFEYDGTSHSYMYFNFAICNFLIELSTLCYLLIIVTEVIVFLSFCIFRLCLYGACLNPCHEVNGTFLVVALSKGVHNIAVVLAVIV